MPLWSAATASRGLSFLVRGIGGELVELWLIDITEHPHRRGLSVAMKKSPLVAR
jgi:hypothetical protein